MHAIIRPISCATRVGLSSFLTTSTLPVRVGYITQLATLTGMAATGKVQLSDASRKIREEIVHDVLNLYNSNPTEESFRHYAPNAQFEDPLQFSGNLASVKSAFKSLPKLFKDSQVTKYDTELDTNPMKIMLETHYEWKGISKETVIRSVVLLTLDNNEQIIRHEERWNGEPIPNAESGFFGRIKEALRHATGNLAHAMVDSDKPVEKK